MESSFYEALQTVRKGVYGGVYVLLGEADGFTSQWFAKTCREAMQQGQPTDSEQVDVVKYSLQTEPLAQIVSELTDGGLFGSRFVALCSDFDVLTTTYKTKGDDTHLIEVIEWLMEHPLEAPLILLTAAEKLDERKKLTKKLRASKQITTIDTRKHTSKEWVELARLLLGGRSLLTSSQIELVVAKTGHSLGLLAKEFEKMETYAGDRTSLSTEEVNDLVGDSKQVDVFEVVRHFIEGRYALSSSLYNKLEDRSLFAFLALLVRQYRLIARVSESMHLGAGRDQDLAVKLGVHPYALKVAREQARVISADTAKQEIEAIALLEYQVKSGGLAEHVALDLLFLRHLATSTA